MEMERHREKERQKERREKRIEYSPSDQLTD